MKIAKFGKVKVDDKWYSISENDEISCNVSNNSCVIEVKALQSKMNTYKVILKTGDHINCNFRSAQEIEAANPSEAFNIFLIRNNLGLVISRYSEIKGYVLNSDLEVFEVIQTYKLGKIKTFEKLIAPIKPKMNTYKIISGETYPTFERLMTSQLEVKSASLREACCEFMKTKPGYEFFGYILNTETLNLFYVQYHRELNGKEYINQWYKGKLEKPKMNKYKLIPNQNNLNPSYEEMMSSVYLIEADSPENALEQYREFNPKANCGMVLNMDSLKLYRVLFDIHLNKYYDCFDKKLEKSEVKPKPIEKPMNNLSFKTLTEANNKRLPLFKNSKGLPAHSKPDGSDWSHAEWLQAVIGELGEYANIMKKVQRGDLTMEEAKPSIEKELADVQTYFSILAQQLNVDLGQAVEDKFNEVSDRVDADVYISNDKVLTNDELIIKSSEEFDKEQKSKDKDKFKAIFESADKDGKYAEKLYKQFWIDVEKKENLKEAMEKVKVKRSDLKKPVINSQITDVMVSVGLTYLANQVCSHWPKAAQKFITLQDLNNGKVYTSPFVSGRDSNVLQELSKLVVIDAPVMKTLQNGKDYDGFNVSIGDMIQYSDDRNVLYSLRVTKIE